MSVYLDADPFVMPSRWEGLSLALLEAMATERTVVAIEVEGMKVALADGAGLLVTPEAVTEQGAQFTTMLEDQILRVAVATKTRGRVAEQFDSQKRASAVPSLYEILTSARSTSATNARFKL